MVTLTEFLLARIAEDERAAERAVQWRTVNGLAWIGPTPEEAAALCMSGHRLFAECQAKRRIVEEHDAKWAHPLAASTPAMHRYQNNGRVNGLWFAMRSLGLPYADHPDYDPNFRP